MSTTYSQDFIDTHRDINIHHDWYESVYEDFDRICTILGIELDKDEPGFSGFWSQGDGASWTGRYRPVELTSWGIDSRATYDLAPGKIREHAPKDEELHRIADELCMLARIYHPVHAKVTRHSSTYSHSHTMQIGEWEYYDEELEIQGVDDLIAEHIESTMLVLFQDLADWLYNTLEREHDYMTSDEAVAEALKANEIEEAA